MQISGASDISVGAPARCFVVACSGSCRCRGADRCRRSGTKTARIVGTSDSSRANRPDAGLTTSEWARQTLRRAERGIAAGDSEAKLGAIRRAAAHRFPTADIEQMLHEIEGGYLDGDDD